MSPPNTAVRSSVFVGTLASFASDKKRPYFGTEALLSTTERGRPILRRGPPVRNAAFQALKAFGEIRLLGFPCSDPSILTVSRRERVGDDIAPGKQEPPFPAFSRDNLRGAWRTLPTRRFSACTHPFPLMETASLRYDDAGVTLIFWRADAAMCGRCVYMSKRANAAIAWAPPCLGFASECRWPDALLEMRNANSQHPGRVAPSLLIFQSVGMGRSTSLPRVI